MRLTRSGDGLFRGAEPSTRRLELALGGRRFLLCPGFLALDLEPSLGKPRQPSQELRALQLPLAQPGGEARPDSSARAEREKPAAGGRPALRPALDLGAPASDLAAAPPKASTGASSKIVQRPTSASEPALLPFVQLPVPPLPAPSAGSGFVPAGLLLGAVAMLVLYLGSLGLLFGRLSLASAPWRHQAYLTPQQRPG